MRLMKPAYAVTLKAFPLHDGGDTYQDDVKNEQGIETEVALNKVS